MSFEQYVIINPSDVAPRIMLHQWRALFDEYGAGEITRQSVVLDKVDWLLSQKWDSGKWTMSANDRADLTAVMGAMDGRGVPTESTKKGIEILETVYRVLLLGEAQVPDYDTQEKIRTRLNWSSIQLGRSSR